MLNKGEIETCKEELVNYIEFMESAGDNAGWARGLRWYIKRLETDNEDLQKSVDQIYDDYQDAGKKMFDYAEQVEKLETQEQKLIEKLEEKLNTIKKEQLPNLKTVTDLIQYKGYAEGRIKSFEEILEILKGEKE